MVMRFEEFQSTCEALRQKAPSCANWRLSFRSEDLQREFWVSATLGTFTGQDVVHSANADADAIAIALANIGGQLAGFSGDQDAEDRARRQILRELGLAR